jgi:hypothetical protein
MRAKEFIVEGSNQVDFKKNLLTILQQKYPNTEFVAQSDRVESADSKLIVIADTAEEDSYVGCVMWDISTGPYKGALGLAIKQTTEQLLQANPGKKPALFIDGDNENPEAWAHIANKLNYKLITDDELSENFADGRNPQDKGDSRRHGIPKHASLSQLDKIRSSKTASPRKKQLAHWQANMRRGRMEETLNESKSADLYKGAAFDKAESILASNMMGGAGGIGNRPQPELSNNPQDTWAWRRRGAERYLRPSTNINLDLDSSEEEYAQWKKDRQRAEKRFPEKRYPSGDASVSLTRDKRIAHNFIGTDGGVIFTLNQELLARDLGKRLHPYSDIHGTSMQRHRGNESEESVYGGIPNIKKYIKHIEVVGNGFDPAKYPNLSQYVQQPVQQRHVKENKDIQLITKHYFPVDDEQIIVKYKMKQDHKGYYLPQWNTSGRVFDANFTSLKKLYGQPHTTK